MLLIVFALTPHAFHSNLTLKTTKAGRTTKQGKTNLYYNTTLSGVLGVNDRVQRPVHRTSP